MGTIQRGVGKIHTKKGEGKIQKEGVDKVHTKKGRVKFRKRGWVIFRKRG